MVQEAWSVIARTTIVAVAACVVACASDPKALERDRVAADTGGYALRLVIRRPSTLQAELYEVDRTGKAGFGGGPAALEGRVTWQRDLTEADAIQFRSAMSQCPWVVEGRPDDRGPDKAEPVTTVSVTMPGGLVREFTLRGDQPQVQSFVNMIKPWVADRHRRLLDKLPEATEPPKPKPAATEAPQRSPT